MTVSFYTLGGVTGNFFDKDKDENSPLFFQPFKTPQDALHRLATLVTAPVFFSGISLVTALLAGYELLKAIGNVCTGNFTQAKENMKECGGYILTSPISLITGMLSPLINLIDFIGSIITSIKPDANEIVHENLSYS